MTLDASRRIAAGDRGRAGLAVASLTALNAALFWLAQRLVVRAIWFQHGAPAPVLNPNVAIVRADVLALPYPAILHQLHPPESVHVELIAIAALQTGVLFGLWRMLRARALTPLIQAVVGLGVVALSAEALTSRAVTSLDVYAYAGYAKLGLAHAYAPPATPFGADFAPVNRLWGQPMVPCFYGPLWVAIEQLFAGPAATLGQAVFATRLVGLGALGGVAAALRFMHVPAALIALLLLNPALYMLYVVNAHNDIVGVAFGVFALAAAASFPLLAAALVAAAGLVKLSLLPLGFAVFAAPQPAARRLLYVVVSIVIVAGVLALFDGGFLQLVFNQALHVNARPANWNVVLTRLLAGLTPVVLAAAFFWARIARSGVWPMVSITGLTYPWYLVWGLPYALRAPAIAMEFLVLLPLAAAMLDTEFPSLHPRQYALAAMLGYLVFEAVRYRVRGIALPGAAVPLAATLESKT